MTPWMLELCLRIVKLYKMPVLIVYLSFIFWLYFLLTYRINDIFILYIQPFLRNPTPVVQ